MPPDKREHANKPAIHRVAQVLAEEKFLGTAGVCAKYNVSPRTILKWKHAYRDDPKVVPLIEAAYESAKTDWLEIADTARRTLLNRVLVLAATSTHLREVVGALKIVSDAVLAEQVVRPQPGAQQFGPTTQVNVLVEQGRVEALQSIGGSKALQAAVEQRMLDAQIVVDSTDETDDAGETLDGNEDEDGELSSGRNAMGHARGEGRACKKAIAAISKLTPE